MQEENAYIVHLDKPFVFEGYEYTTLDISGLVDLNTQQLCDAQRMLEKKGRVPTMIELDTEYNMILASMASGLPIELFMALPAAECIKIKNRIRMVFFGGTA